MLENSADRFIENIFNFITNKSEVRGLLVKKHSGNLRNEGEFSFTNSLISWCQILDIDLKDNKDDNLKLLEYIKKVKEDIIELSEEWTLKVREVREERNRVFLYLDRPRAVKVALSEAIRNESIISNLRETSIFVNVDSQLKEDSSITSLRVKYIAKVIENLCRFAKKFKDLPEIRVTTKTDCHDNTVVVGPVLNVNTNFKEVSLKDSDFIRLRQTEMTLIAQHKYGARVSTDSYWIAFILHLGESAVAYELLQIKPSSVIRIDFENGSVGCSRGASFILYNCARLETLIKTFNDKVQDGTYPSLPEFDAIDFTLLKEEDEWNLIFNYVLGFPSMLESTVDVKGTNVEFRPNNICQFLNGMVRLISQYYRRTRILLEPRNHLLPLIFARIHMLKILNNILKNCLKILNIKSVTHM